MTQLKPEQLHMMRLMQRDGDNDGWAKCSPMLFPFVVENLPGELVETKSNNPKGDAGGWARLTEAGKIALKWA